MNSTFGYVSFILHQSIAKYPKDYEKLSLLNSPYQYEIYQFLPKSFTITTKNSSSKFNIDMIQNASQTIAQEIKNNPNCNEYHLDISDNDNVLGKFSDLFEGKIVTFTEDNLPVSFKIIRILKIKNCPEFLKPYDLQRDISNNYYSMRLNQNLDSQVVIDQPEFNSFIKRKTKQTFTIVAHKKEYECKLYGVYSSLVIREYVKNHPESTRYEYDIEDEYGEFESIQELFNFQELNITKDNIENVKKMIYELEITYLKEIIEHFDSKFESISNSFETQEEEVLNIEDRIELLFNYCHKPVEEITKDILDKYQTSTKEEVQEMTSFLIERIKSDNNRIEEIFEIIIRIDEISRSKDEFKMMSEILPNVIKQVLFMLGITKSICSFAYLLYKNNLISKDDLYSSIKNNYKKSSKNKMKALLLPVYKKIYKAELHQIIQNNINAWFLPELIEIGIFELIKPNDEQNTQKKNVFIKNDSPKFSINSVNQLSLLDEVNKQEYNSLSEMKIYDECLNNFLNQYLPNKLNEYREMRDSRKSTDEITLAIQKDDVDTLQNILSQRPSDEKNSFIPFNIFDNFYFEEKMSLINYSCIYGSIKCFKYLLLNHHQLDVHSFESSIYGNNIEIIKTIDQRISTKTHYIEYFIPTIIQHKNELFDWLFDKIYSDHKFSPTHISAFLDSIEILAVRNTNAHVLIKLYNKKHNISLVSQKVISVAISNGFYSILKLFCDLTLKKISVDNIKIEDGQIKIKINSMPAYFIENLSIIKMVCEGISQASHQSIFELALSRDYMSIIEYYMEYLLKKDVKFTKMNVIKCLVKSFEKNSDKLFKYLYGRFKEIYPKYFETVEIYEKLLDESIKNGKSKIAKTALQLVISMNKKKDFSVTFILSVSNNLPELCQYMIDIKFA